MKKILSALVLFCAFFANIFAQPYTSTQSHEGKVNMLFPFESETSQDKSFYSIGNDGFIIKWADDGMGEHYQITDMQLQMVVRNPATGDIAVYDTDGISVHRVSVLNSKTFARRYTKRFTDSVTSISFSEKGTYLIVGTASVNGTYIINARTGSISKRANDITGVVTMAKTGPSEKTAVMYSPTGSLIYYDLTRMRFIRKFSTESKLQQPVLFGSGKLQNRFFAGVRDNAIYIIDATNGKTIAQYSAKDPIIFSSPMDGEDDQGLYFTTNNGRNYSLMMVNAQTLVGQIGAGSSQIFNPPAALLVKYFTGLKSRDTFTCGTKNSGSVILGTQSGNIYTMTDIPESETYSLFPITEKMYEKIYDLDTDGTDFYILTRDSIFRTSYSKTIERLSRNSGYTNLIKYNDYAILWSKNTKKTVQLANLSDSTAPSETLLTPQNEIRTLRVFGNKIVYILGTSSVGIFDIDSRKNAEVYSGTSIQDAALIDDNTLYVAKTSTGSNDSPLISVNIQTKETVPLKFTGNVAFSLSYDYERPNSPVYGIAIKTLNGRPSTEVFSYSPSSKLYKAMLRLSDEDTSAFTSLYAPYLYTNIGRNQVYVCNINTRQNMTLRRSASMPVKAECTSQRVAVLNHNGSISWYAPNSQTILKDWYLTVDGDWFEF